MKKYAVLLLLTPWLCRADEPPGKAKQLETLQALASTIQYQKGDISLKNGLATVTLPENFRYLSPDDTDTVLHKLWGNPQGLKTQGMIVPAERSVLSQDSWAVVISYDDDGYVKDSDAGKINYAKLLEEMQAAAREASAEREKKSYPSIELVGWATPPHYDPATHKMYWAKEIRFGGSKHTTLNYNIRVLGRGGVLVLNAVAPMTSLPEIEEQVPALVKMADFNAGKRYADFNNSSDKVAAYGLAALVAGGIAAKAGLFKVLWVGLLAFKKFIIIGFIALSGFIKKLFGRKQPPPSSPPPPAPTTDAQ
jgi:uncharacterized membrane-anchored protein